MKPHQDGPAYFPVVAIISLGSPVLMDFTPHSRLRTSNCVLPNDVEHSNLDAFETGGERWMDDHHPFSVLLMPRSLLIFKDNAYSDYLHGIKDSEEQRYDKATINQVEALRNHKLDQPSPSCDSSVEVRNGDIEAIHRRGTRVLLTCRLVLKVHKNLFKF